MDYSYRINQKGYKLVVNPLSEIYHKVSSSTGGVGSLLNSYYINRNLFLYLSENVNIVNKNTVWLYYIKGRIFEMIDKAKKWKFSNVYATLLGIFHGIIRRYGFNRLS